MSNALRAASRSSGASRPTSADMPSSIVVTSGLLSAFGSFGWVLNVLFSLGGGTYSRSPSSRGKHASPSRSAQSAAKQGARRAADSA
eukprot:2552035-Prymnesium_polylepis.1